MTVQNSMSDEELRKKLEEAVMLATVERLVKDQAGRQLILGQHLLGQGKLAMAELCFETALQEGQAQPDSAKRSSIVLTALIGKSEVARRRRCFEASRRFLDRAERIAREANNSKLEGLVYEQRAEVLLSEGRPSQALTELQAAREAFSRSEEAALERARVAFRLGGVCQKLLRFRQALVYYEQSETYAREINQHNLVLLSLLGQLEVLSRWGRNREVLERCKRVEEFVLTHRSDILDAKIDLQTLERFALRIKAGSYYSLGRLDQAVELYERVLKASKDPKEQAQLHSTLALYKFLMGKPQEAKQHEQEARKFLTEVGELPEVLLNLVQLNLARGQTNSADEQFFHALVEVNQEKVNESLGIVFKTIEIALSLQQGKITTARDLAHYLYDDLLTLDAEPFLVSVLTTLGELAWLAGKLDEAKECYQRALKIADQWELPLPAVSALTGLAKLAAARSEFTEAQQYLDRATQLSRKAGLRLQERHLLVEQARLMSMATHVTKAEGVAASAALERLLYESKELQAPSLELDTLAALAMAYLQEEKPTEARRCLDEAIVRAGEVGMEFIRLLCCGLLGLVLSELGERTLAKEYLEQALSGMEERGMEIEAKYIFLERYRDLTGFGW